MASTKQTEVVKTTVTESVASDFTTKARHAGCNDSEYLRDLIHMDLYGVTYGEHVANHRRSVIGYQRPTVVQAGAKE